MILDFVETRSKTVYQYLRYRDGQWTLVWKLIGLDSTVTSVENKIKRDRFSFLYLTGEL